MIGARFDVYQDADILQHWGRNLVHLLGDEQAVYGGSIEEEPERIMTASSSALHKRYFSTTLCSYEAARVNPDHTPALENPHMNRWRAPVSPQFLSCLLLPEALARPLSTSSFSPSSRSSRTIDTFNSFMSTQGFASRCVCRRHCGFP
jgi:hypothetical protein